MSPLLVFSHTKQNINTHGDSAVYFIENKGQITDQFNYTRKDIDFKLPLQNINVFIGDGRLHYQWYKSDYKAKNNKYQNVSNLRKYKQADNKVEIYRLDVELLNANQQAPVTISEPIDYYEQYYTNTTSEEGLTAHACKKITYHNIYPFIDWVLYGSNSGMKYDFIVHPGGNPDDIKIKFLGGKLLNNKDGSVTATTPFGSITEAAPYSYLGETKVNVASSFNLNDNVLSFNVAPQNQTLIIDPSINWSTYYGGTNLDEITDNTTDNAGNIYIAGYTYSSNNIATSGSHQSSFNLASDAFIAKFTNAGVRQWATYYGGTNSDDFYAVTCDGSGDVYAGGATLSTGIASTGAHQTTITPPLFNGFLEYDGLLVKFNSSGSRIWATYYGGPNTEAIRNLDCDANGNVYLSGSTNSSTAIATPGAYITANMNNSIDGMLVKFDNNGVRQWGSYFGGNSSDFINGLSYDGLGSIYIAGTTGSTGLATTGSHQTSARHCFFSKFNTTTGARIFTSYFGGTAPDFIYDVDCDGAGNFYLCGYAISSSGIATTGAYQTSITLNAGRYGFLTKFNSVGVQQWGTYFGTGVGNMDFGGVSVTPFGDVYVAGITSSSSLPTVGAYQNSLGGAEDVFITEWNTNGGLIWSTYLGGPGSEESNSPDNTNCRWNPLGYLAVSGKTLSDIGIATTGAHQTSRSGSQDGFLTNFITDTIAYVKYPFIDTAFCKNDSFYLKYNITHAFKTANSFTVQLSDASGSFTNPTIIGSKTANIADSIKCILPPNLPAGNGYRIRIIASAPSRISENNGINIRIKTGPINLLASSNSAVCENSNINLTASTSSTTALTWSWTGPNSFTSILQNPVIPNASNTKAGNYILTAKTEGCIVKDTVTVSVKPLPVTPLATTNGPVCTGDTLKLFASTTTTGATYDWSGPNSYISSLQSDAIISASAVNSGIYTVTAKLNGCNSIAATINCIVHNITPKPNAMSNSPVCKGGIIYLSTNLLNNANYNWTGPSGFTSVLHNPFVSPANNTNAGKYIVTATQNGCISEPDTIDILINTVISIGSYVSPNDTICNGTPTTFVSISTGSGLNPQYQWYKNSQPVNGATYASYTTNNTQNGDKYFCTIYSATTCNTPVILSSDTIAMVVLNIQTMPNVKLISIPAQPLPGQLATFSLQLQHGGIAPQYQWMRNGQPVTGATNATWSVASLHPCDAVWCRVISNDPCALEDTISTDTIKACFPTSVSSISSNTNISLYPNPNNGSFTLQGSVNATGVANIEISNAIGQVVYSANTSISQQQINTQVNLNNAIASGVYMLKLTAGGVVKTVQFTVAQ